MTEPATRLMSATEFCTWEDGTETRYELVDGFPVARAPGSADHVQLAMNASLVTSSSTPSTISQICDVHRALAASRQPCAADPLHFR